MIDVSELVRIDLRPGLHGARCRDCDRLFDAYETPCPMDDVIMRLSTMRCPECGGRSAVDLLMPWKYREMVAASIAREAESERVRLVADKYIPRT